MGKWSVQSDNANATVLVSDSYCRNGDTRTDILVCDKSDTSGAHAHVAYDPSGNESYSYNPYDYSGDTGSYGLDGWSPPRG